MAGSDRTIKERLGPVLFCTMLVFAVLASNATATPRAVVSWSPPRGVNEGAPIPFSWTASRLGRNHRLVIQRPVGTAHTWQTILKLPSSSGSAELPGLGLGKYRLRLAALRGRRLLAQQVVGIGVFGQVPFSTLFMDPLKGTYATPGNSFPYVGEEYAEGEPAFSVEHNHCLSVHIGFVPGIHNEGGTGTLTLVQESRDPVSVSTAYDTIGSLDAELTPGQSWAVNVSYKEGDAPTTYYNGYAVCNSTEAIVSSD